MTSNNCGIYKITNAVDGKFYIGSSCNITKRLCFHRSQLIRDKHFNRHLQRAWNKYGAQAFTFETVLLCDIETKLYFEQVFIDVLCPAYNFAKGALATMQGYKHTEETRRKVSEGLKGNTNFVGHKHTEETIRKMSEAKKGKPLSEEHKRNISEARKGEKHPFYGKNHTDETKRKMSEAKKGNQPWLGRTHSDETKRKISEAMKCVWVERLSNE